MMEPEAKVFTANGAMSPDDSSYPEDVLLYTVSGLRDKSTFHACFERALSNHGGGVIRRASPYTIEGIVYERFFIDKDPRLTFFLNTDLAKPLIWLLKKEGAQREETLAVIEDAIRICNENESVDYRYQVELNFGTSRLPVILELGDCVVYQFQPKDLPPRDPNLGPDPHVSEKEIVIGYGSRIGPVQVFYTFVQGRVQAFHLQQAIAKASKNAEEIALFLSVVFKSPIYTKLGAGVESDTEGGFIDYREKMQTPLPVFVERTATKITRPDTSPNMNQPIVLLGQTKELTIPSDILKLYANFQSLPWGNKQLFLMAAAMYRTALRLLVVDQRRWCGEAAQANTLLWSALEAIVGRGRQIKKNKRSKMESYVKKRLGDTELTRQAMVMWRHRNKTAHQSRVWSWQLYDETDMRLELGQYWEWGMLIKSVGAVERVVNAILIDYLLA